MFQRFGGLERDAAGATREATFHAAYEHRPWLKLVTCVDGSRHGLIAAQYKTIIEGLGGQVTKIENWSLKSRPIASSSSSQGALC